MEPLPMFHAGRMRRCAKCAGTDWRTSKSGRLVCRDCEKAHKRERKDRRHRERGDRCGCGTDAVSLNPAEIVVHNWGGGPCRIVPKSPNPERTPPLPQRTCDHYWMAHESGTCPVCGESR